LVFKKKRQVFQLGESHLEILSDVIYLFILFLFLKTVLEEKLGGNEAGCGRGVDFCSPNYM
jgi:hypothetical protein